MLKAIEAGATITGLPGVAGLVGGILFCNKFGWDLDRSPLPMLPVLGGILLAVGIALSVVYIVGKRMLANEIEAKVDHQRSTGRITLIVTLAIGLVIGMVTTAMAFLYPVDPTFVGDGLWESLCAFLATWKQYLIVPVAVLALTLSLVLSKGGRKAVKL